MTLYTTTRFTPHLEHFIVSLILKDLSDVTALPPLLEAYLTDRLISHYVAKGWVVEIEHQPDYFSCDFSRGDVEVEGNFFSSIGKTKLIAIARVVSQMISTIPYGVVHVTTNAEIVHLVPRGV